MKFRGIVEKGQGRGRELGYPTANIPLADDVSGIFAARVRMNDGEARMAAAFADPVRDILELHLIDFRGDLYGQSAEVELLMKIRESAAYADDEALRAAIAADIAQVRTYFQN